MMGNVAAFLTKGAELRRGDYVIVRTDRGVEWGEVVKDEAMMKAIADSSATAGEVLRKATESDYIRQQKIIDEVAPEEHRFCQSMIQEHHLPMRLVETEHIFGGNKIIFYFLADGRVDFRALVKDLAKKYQTRIEMRQIGVRDEARLLAEYEHCGCQLCCRTFIKNLEPVTMKMAKNQKATLDPSKISGRCGRLMCCLRFEDKTYDELKQNLPKRGTDVRTSEGEGSVVDYDILQQLVQVELRDGRRHKFNVKDIERLGKQRKPGRSRGRSSSGGKNS
jgi:cell fate regulator YaaT (PSP1 superfamily)